MLNVINITQARQNLSQLIDEIVATQEPKILIRESMPQAVIVPYEQYVQAEADWTREFDKSVTTARKSFKKFLAKRKIPYPKTEEEIYALVDKISGRH
ncbi:type II toxin-antitoxin system Phd/YefM family antitoxin [Candidatus Gottesmanbacteria bacterium]|nr:type II toxin-antitoxin system Phd/YefM family antitoxin [Candidatus Gottesmanbacteria bacterium]